MHGNMISGTSTTFVEVIKRTTERMSEKVGCSSDTNVDSDKVLIGGTIVSNACTKARKTAPCSDNTRNEQTKLHILIEQTTIHLLPEVAMLHASG